MQNSIVPFTSKVVGDKLIRQLPTDNPNVRSAEIVLTQQEFTECYKKWILPFMSTITAPESNVGANWEMR